MQTIQRHLIKFAVLAACAVSLSTPFAFANSQSVVVSVPGVSLIEIKAYATSIDKLTLSESIEATRPGVERSTELRKRLEKAQSLWLKGDIEEARSEFRAIGELSLKADWKGEQRAVILMAFLRLAQSAPSGTEKQSWLEAAARAYSDLNPDPSVFPPPLVAEFNTTRTRMLDEAVEFDARDIFPDARFVIIDGLTIDTEAAKLSRVPPGVHRITALSDTHASVTEFLTGKQLRLFRAVPPFLVEGSCATARLKANSDIGTFPNAEIYRGRHCPAENLQLKPELVSRRTTGGDLLQTSEPTRPAARALNRHWLWIVGGAVIAGAGYAVAREMNRNQAPTPVHRSGF